MKKDDFAEKWMARHEELQELKQQELKKAVIVSEPAPVPERSEEAQALIDEKRQARINRNNTVTQ